MFNMLTGMGVSTAHYPGTTREIHYGESIIGTQTFTVADVPGAYSLFTDTEESWVSRRALLDMRPDVVIVVVDPANMVRNLALVLEVLDLGVPCVVAMNLFDEAQRAGIAVDSERLGELLGVAVVQTVATQGLGVESLMTTALAAKDGGGPPAPLYGSAVERVIRQITLGMAGVAPRPYGLGARAFALQLLAGVEDFSILLEDDARRATESVSTAGSDAATAARRGEPPTVWLARERTALAERIANETVLRTELQRRANGWRIATSPWTGVPLLLLVMASVFGFLFFIGDALASGFSALWGASVSPVMRTAVAAVLGDTTTARVVLWGLDAGIEASLAIGVPYILTFYVLLGILEDSGYLNAVAFLADRAMHRMGLHGHALIPIVAAAGCNVPAVLAARSLPDKRERLIASTLVALVPCSARTAVVLGAVGHFIGILPAIGVLGVVFVLWVATGLGLNALLPGRSTGLVMEVFAFRRPAVRSVLRKAWTQFREFLFVATPIVIAGSLVLGWLYETGLLVRIAEPLSPVFEGLLGLPAVAGVTLMIGMLRKELALQLLVVMAVAIMGAGARDLTTFMTSTDLFVYALVNAIAVPCVSTIAVLAREHGGFKAAMIVGLTIVLGIVTGSTFAHVLPALGF